MKRIGILLLVVLAGCATSKDAQKTADADSAPVYSVSKGGQPVGVIPAGVLVDAKRSKNLELSIEYPTKPGSYPVVIFSHGFGSSGRGYVGMSAYWASHGYVVIKPTHADAGVLRDAKDTKTAQEVWSAQTAADWRNRVEDIRLILDSIPALEEQFPELKGKLDAAHIGVGGHGYGAYTAMLIGGVRTFAGSTPTSYADPRVKAVVAMSPQGPSPSRGLTSESFATLTVPAFFITGSRDSGATEGEDPAWRRQAFELSPAGDKWFLSIAGASQMTFAGTRIADLEVPPSPETAPVIQRPYPNDPGIPVQQPQGRAPAYYGMQGLTNLVRTSSLAFWDTYLRSEPAGREHLGRLKERGDSNFATK